MTTIHHSIDIETMDNGPQSAIVQIGIASFIEGRDNDLSSQCINIDYLEYDTEYKDIFSVGADTMLWWAQQSSEARESAFQKRGHGAVPLLRALADFDMYMTSKVPTDKVCIWANPPQFDLTILRYAYHVANRTPPWKHWQERCLRTLRHLVPETKEIKREGVHHNAMDDAIYQAHQIKLGLERLRGAMGS